MMYVSPCEFYYLEVRDGSVLWDKVHEITNGTSDKISKYFIILYSKLVLFFHVEKFREES